MKTMFVINYDGIKVKDIKPSEKEGIIDVLDEDYDCPDISKKDYIPVVKDGEIYHLVITDTLKK